MMNKIKKKKAKKNSMSHLILAMKFNPQGVKFHNIKIMLIKNLTCRYCLFNVL